MMARILERPAVCEPPYLESWLVRIGEEEAEVAKMELLQLMFVASADGPGFTVVEEVSEHYDTVDFDLHGEYSSSLSSSRLSS